MNKNLEKFEEIVKILDKDTASVSEVAELVATIIQVVKETKEFIEKQATDNKKELNSFVNRLTEQEVQKIAEALDNLEKKAEKAYKSISDKTKSDLDSLTKNLYLELIKLKNLIPKEVDFSEVNRKIDEIEKKVPNIKEIEIQKIRDELENLEGDERLKVEAIEGTHRITVSTTKPTNPQVNDIWIDVS